MNGLDKVVEAQLDTAAAEGFRGDDGLAYHIDARGFDNTLDELHRLCPLDEPSSPLWDVWMRFRDLGQAGGR